MPPGARRVRSWKAGTIAWPTRLARRRRTPGACQLRRCLLAGPPRRIAARADGGGSGHAGPRPPPPGGYPGSPRSPVPRMREPPRHVGASRKPYGTDLRPRTPAPQHGPGSRAPAALVRGPRVHEGRRPSGHQGPRAEVPRGQWLASVPRAPCGSLPLVRQPRRAPHPLPGGRAGAGGRAPLPGPACRGHSAACGRRDREPLPDPRAGHPGRQGRVGGARRDGPAAGSVRAGEAARPGATAASGRPRRARQPGDRRHRQGGPAVPGVVLPGPLTRRRGRPGRTRTVAHPRGPCR
jgi:hypothetical protein